MENAIRQKAKELLEKGEVKVVVGYGLNKRRDRATPVFITKPEDAEKLVFNPLCVNNLSLYLTRKHNEIKALGRPAIVGKGCDIKTIAVLIAEGQLKREDVYIIGVTCNGVAYKQELFKGELRPEIMPTKCHNCDVRNPHLTDFIVGEKSSFVPPDASTGMVFDKIKELDKLNLSEKWKFWQEHFSRCVKCYACSKVCPLCYCERCIVEKNVPQWIETSAHPRGNLAWNLVRAMHLTGRCTFCGECERSCPVNIPLNLINQKMSLTVKEAFDYKSGYDPNVHPPLIVFNPDDKEDFIK